MKNEARMLALKDLFDTVLKDQLLSGLTKKQKKEGEEKKEPVEKKPLKSIEITQKKAKPEKQVSSTLISITKLQDLDQQRQARAKDESESDTERKRKKRR